MISKTENGVPLAVEAWTVSSYGARWLDDVARPRLRPATIASYTATLRRHIEPEIGTVQLRRLQPTQVRALLASKLESGLSARSVQIIHSTLRTILAEAVREELIERNVAALVRAPTLERLEAEPWSVDEASQFLATAVRHRLGALFTVGVAIGLRRGELLGLRWEDVDLASSLLRVQQTVQRLPGYGLVIGPPKSRRSRRTIPLPESSASALAEHQRRQTDERRSAGDRWQDSGLVFTSTIGTVVEPRNLSRLFEQLMVAAGVRRIRFHDLRHTCASLLLAQGVPPRVVMEVLGHSQLAITMDLYSHVMPTALREAADAIDRAFES
ncbi:tyrosine-type recombinase/integrase [Naumannella halotolerans]|nr:site-specific integrase [Naumannella halotolerans]